MLLFCYDTFHSSNKIDSFQYNVRHEQFSIRWFSIISFDSVISITGRLAAYEVTNKDENLGYVNLETKQGKKLDAELVSYWKLSQNT